MIRLREYERHRYKETSAADVRSLERACVRLGKPLLKFGRESFQAQQYVGFLQEGAVQLQVLPKIVDDEESDLGLFVALLVLAQRVPAIDIGEGDLKRAGGSFIEFWIWKFAQDLRAQLKRNPRRQYQRRREHPRFLRGKLLAHKLADGKHETSMRYPCELHPFGVDHPLNQLLRYCNRLLTRQAVTLGTRSILEGNDVLLADVELRSFTAAEAARLRLDRLSASYSFLVANCRLILEQGTVDLQAGRLSHFSLMFDMNKLFQESVFRALQRHASGLSLGGDRITSVRREVFLGKLFGEFAMRVDIVVSTASGRRVLVDTKNKVPEGAMRHGGLSQTDFYQMFGYARAGKDRNDEIVLLYPTSLAPRDFERQGVRLRVRGVELSECWDVQRRRFRSDHLAKLVAGAL